MARTDTVKKIIGSILEEKGFKFTAVERMAWDFTRRQGELIQTILIYKNRYEKAMRMRFSTNAWRLDRTNVSASEIIPAGLYPNKFDDWFYEDDDSFCQVINQFLEIILQYGLPALERLNVNDEITPTKEMAGKLFDEADELDQKFIEQYHIQSVEFTIDNIDKWMSLVSELIKDNPYDNSQEVQDLFIEIAAFLGKRMIEYGGGKWAHYEGSRVTDVMALNMFITTTFPVFTFLCEVWEEEDITRLKRELMWYHEARLPLSVEQMGKLSTQRATLNNS